MDRGTAEIRWSLTAAEDLRLLEDWIARDSVLNATQFTDRLGRLRHKLETSPLIHRVVPEFGQDGLREIIFRGYRVVYSNDKTTVTVLRVLHGALDLRRLATREPWSFE